MVREKKTFYFQKKYLIHFSGGTYVIYRLIKTSCFHIQSGDAAYPVAIYNMN